MGERAFVEEANERDLEAMAAELASALRPVPTGLITSRTHQQTSDDRPVASRLASSEEACRLVGVLGDLCSVENPPPPEGLAAHHARSPWPSLPASPSPWAPQTAAPRWIFSTWRQPRAGVRPHELPGSRHLVVVPDPAPLRLVLRVGQGSGLALRRSGRGPPCLRPGQARVVGPPPHLRQAVAAEARMPDFERMQALDRPVPPLSTVADAARARGVEPVALMIDLALETDFNQFLGRAIGGRPERLRTGAGRSGDARVRPRPADRRGPDRRPGRRLTRYHGPRRDRPPRGRAPRHPRRPPLSEGLWLPAKPADPPAPPARILAHGPGAPSTQIHITNIDRTRSAVRTRGAHMTDSNPTASTADPPAYSGDLPWIISVDDHVVEPPTLWTDRLSASDREVGPRVVRDACETIPHPDSRRIEYRKGGDGPQTDWWLYEDLAKPVPMAAACVGIPVDKHSVLPINYEDMRPGCHNPKARLADMDINHTERSLCFPFITRFCGQMFLEATDKDLALRCVAAYNDWMVEEWCGDSGGRLLPLCLIPLSDPEAAAAEVRRNAARGVRAITFPEMPHHLELPSIHDPVGYWNPVFEACDETGTVLCMHIGSGSRLAENSPFAPRAANTVMTFSMAQISMVEWLVSGLFVRYPNLKIAYSEGQIGWMPYVLERVDKTFTHTGFAELPPAITEPPSTYMAGRVYGCFFDDETGIANRDVIGVGQMLFEVDYPHQDSTWPNSMAVVERFAQRVSPDELERILRTNAMEMLGLD
jgi:predicted TIM-barrel fold metal-dependent hydrolase